MEARRTKAPEPYRRAALEALGRGVSAFHPKTELFQFAADVAFPLLKVTQPGGGGGAAEGTAASSAAGAGAGAGAGSAGTTAGGESESKGDKPATKKQVEEQALREAKAFECLARAWPDASDASASAPTTLATQQKHIGTVCGAIETSMKSSLWTVRVVAMELLAKCVRSRVRVLPTRPNADVTGASDLGVPTQDGGAYARWGWVP